MCSLIFCYDKRDWEEPSYLKFLKALQEYPGNIFSYLVSVNIVNICLWWGGGGVTIYPGVKCPPAQPSCMLSFLCNDKRDWEESGHLKFLNVPLEDTANKLAYLVPVNSQSGGGVGEGGTIFPWVKCPPPQPSFHFYVMIEVRGVGGGGGRWGEDNLPRGKVSFPSTLMYAFHFYVIM